ncbi:MAG: metalloregulator ArsR/SmtB family transcription factor [Pseudomonadota bacterium]
MPKPVRALAADVAAVATQIAKSLSDPNRLQIVHLLAGQTLPVCACDIVEWLDVSQPTVSHHLKTLADAGVVDVGRIGTWRFYRLKDSARALLQTLLAGAR